MEYKWKLIDTEFTKDKGKVFSCFSCGGGSTMGYKLAGFINRRNQIAEIQLDLYRHLFTRPQFLILTGNTDNYGHNYFKVEKGAWF